MDTTAAPTRDYVVHAALPTRKQTISIDVILADPLSKCGLLCHCNLIIARQPVSVPQLHKAISHLLFSHSYPLAQIRLRILSLHIPLASHISCFIYFSLARSLAKKKKILPHQMDGRCSLSAVTKSREPEGNAQDSPSA